ncbi:MAG TPA: hypothetical protein VIK53_06655 [Verrucomicrobiae bacterium]
MRRNYFILSLVICLLAGCASPPLPPTQYLPPPKGFFPANAFITQRALFSARGMQFALNGYLAMSETGGKRLVITENFGQVIADLLIKPDGKVFVMQSSRMFPARYIRRLVAADVECVFGGTPKLDCPVTMPDPNHFVIDRGGYKLDLRILEIKPGAQPADLFDETKAPKS